MPPGAALPSPYDYAQDVSALRVQPPSPRVPWCASSVNARAGAAMRLASLQFNPMAQDGARSIFRHPIECASAGRKCEVDGALHCSNGVICRSHELAVERTVL